MSCKWILLQSPRTLVLYCVARGEMFTKFLNTTEMRCYLATEQNEWLVLNSGNVLLEWITLLQTRVVLCGSVQHDCWKVIEIVDPAFPKYFTQLQQNKYFSRNSLRDCLYCRHNYCTTQLPTFYCNFFSRTKIHTYFHKTA